MTAMANKARVLAVVALLAVALGGCYLPVRFDTEIEISRSGYYSIIFDGYLAEVTLYDGLRKGEIDKEQEAAKVEILRTDFTRDSSVKEFKYFKQGHFKVHWEKSGDLLKSKMVTFFRRNENMISLKWLKSAGTITVEGKYLRRSDKDQLVAMGLGMQGQVRVITDAKVTQHNATRVVGSGKKTYVWDIKTISDPVPKLIISLY